ncbi:hypothetical protein TVAG_213520 [Trichomonas vaginalis G3]|uniref:Uncharacterized protein n=1 Tax=Trichomonas vaginalis (strain ATCC PRA-98 / G3) TaxID=412133 RepID=A2EYT4_TRIV3|nr:hypothetical protein TVAGG3_0254280 [Trichomonas vaginalis G3]EAY02153.1 hypothetical protein TVAG_213520 [Trichomonas vaginalis G3]KAI5554250.1 hypothetical protein TVAGG3_0254280 [Trichomonas vaginalis G3]|eukprot:XP_001330556.1 hypothetical protein [Trichomonas vaginalis G3]
MTGDDVNSQELPMYNGFESLHCKIVETILGPIQELFQNFLETIQDFKQEDIISVYNALIDSGMPADCWDQFISKIEGDSILIDNYLNIIRVYIERLGSLAAFLQMDQESAENILITLFNNQ